MANQSSEFTVIGGCSAGLKVAKSECGNMEISVGYTKYLVPFGADVKIERNIVFANGLVVKPESVGG